jgi:hypothetical protein
VDASEAKLQFSVVCGLREIVKVDEINLKTGKTWVQIHAQTFLTAVQSSILIAYSVLWNQVLQFDIHCIKVPLPGVQSVKPSLQATMLLVIF